MRPFLALTDLPELGGYPAAARRVLVRSAQALQHSEARFAAWLQPTLSVCGGLLGVAIGFCVQALFFSPKSLPDAIPTAMCCDLVGAAVGGFSGGFVGLQLQARKLRPYLRRAIGECTYPP